MSSYPTREPAPAGEILSGGADPAAIRLAAMNLLSRREHSLGELRQKLRRRFGNADEVESQLQRLVAEGLQSDARFGESFARMRAARGYGPARLRHEMRERQLSDTDINQAFEAAELDWYALAEEVFRKKFGGAGPVDRRERARRMRFMQYRGFAREHYGHLLPE
jgi:regulatory protein